MALATLTIDINARLANLERDLGKVARLSEQSASRMGSAFNSMNTAFMSLAGLGAGALFTGMISSGIALQDELGSLSKKLGISAKDLAGYKFAADQNGTSLETLARGVSELAIKMSAAPDKFAKLGISARDANGALVQIADLVSGMPEGFQKTALLAELMGKQVGPELAELLSIGGNSLREYIAKGQDIYKVTDENAAKAKDFKDQMGELSARLGVFSVAVANELLPGLNDTAKAMNELASEGHPVLALWRALAGMGKVPWDLLAPPSGLKKEIGSDALVKDLQAKIGQLERNKESGNGWLMKKMFGSPEEIDAQIAMYKAQIDTIKKHASELDKPAAQQQTAPKVVPKAVTDLLTGGDKKIVDKEGDYLMQQYEKNLKDRADKKIKMNEAIDEAVYKSAVENARRIADEQEKEAQRAQKSWERFAENVQRNLGDVLYNGLNGKFDGIGEMFKQMLLRMAADAAAAQLTQKMFGEGPGQGWAGALMSMFGANKTTGLAAMDQSMPIMANANGNAFGFAAGGSFTNKLFNNPTAFAFAGGGGFNLGVMGESGPEAVMPLTRGRDGKLGVQAQGGGGVVINDHTVINVGNREDRAQVLSDVSKLIDQKQAQLVDRLSRQGVIA